MLSRTFNRYCRWFSLLPAIALSLPLFLSGCGGGSDGADSKNIVTFWHFWSEPAQKVALGKQIQAFESAHPGVKVDLQELSWNDGKTKLLAAFSSNTAPDLLELGNDWVSQFSSSGVLADLRKLGVAVAPGLSKEALAPGIWQNGLFALPWVVETRVLYYNKGLLASAGVDTSAADTLWDDLLAHAEKVRARGGDLYGFGANGPDRHRLYKKILPFFWSNGGEVLNAEGHPVINSPQNVEALRTYLELARTGIVETQKGLDQLFMQGKLAYWISGPWLADQIRKDNPTLQYGLAPLPKFAGGRSVSFGGGEYLAINEGSTKKDLAKELVSFLASPAQALQFCKDLGGYAPADPSVAGDPYMQSPARRAYTLQLASVRSAPVHPRWLDIEAIIEDEVSAALLGNKNEQQALDDAQNKLTQLLQNSQAAGTEGH
jgi:ABC-type glycerol-3-phosphate transport system substrate-binding protein